MLWRAVSVSRDASRQPHPHHPLPPALTNTICISCAPLCRCIQERSKQGESDCQGLVTHKLAMRPMLSYSAGLKDRAGHRQGLWGGWGYALACLKKAHF